MHGLIAVFARWSFLWVALVSMAADRAPVRLITDWYPQPEHGGFYYALIKGYYREAGLDVEILPGGPNAFPIQRIATKAAEFGMGSTDDVLLANDRGIPIRHQRINFGCIPTTRQIDHPSTCCQTGGRTPAGSRARQRRQARRPWPGWRTPR